VTLPRVSPAPRSHSFFLRDFAACFSSSKAATFLRKISFRQKIFSLSNFFAHLYEYINRGHKGREIMTEEQRWIRKIKKNASREAANGLVAKYYREMFAFVYKQTLDSDLSLDLTQEIFISMLQSIARYDERKSSFRTWLYKLASNRVVDYYRSKSYHYRKLTEPIEGRDFAALDDMVISFEYKEEVRHVVSIVNRLETGTQQVVRLKLFGEYTLKEISDMLEMPLSTVKTRYYAALRAIRAEMEVQGDE
jgi:RNA polymerase sigma-70 factor (ECF subfamily)